MNEQIKDRQDYEQHCREMLDDQSEAWLQYNACIARLPARVNFLNISKEDWQAIRAAEEECAHWNVLREEITRTRKAIDGRTKFSMGPLVGGPLAFAVAAIAALDAQLAEITAKFIPAYERLKQSREVICVPPPPAAATIPLAVDADSLSNAEMADDLHRVQDAKLEAIARDGCCCGEPMSGGQCFGIGMCPRVGEQQRCTRFVTNYLEWIDEINQPKFDEVPAFAE